MPAVGRVDGVQLIRTRVVFGDRAEKLVRQGEVAQVLEGREEGRDVV
jgi:hypothetical protein